MNNSRGIFDSFPGQAPAPSPFAVVPDSPFAAVPTGAPASPFAAIHEVQPSHPFSTVQESAPASPFAPVLRVESPFAAAEDVNGSRPLEPGKPARLPDKRRAPESPFQMADAKEGFGFEAVPSAPAPTTIFAASPFEIAPATSPFAMAPPPQAQAAPAPVSPASPFAFEAAPPPQAPPAFNGWAQPAPPVQPAAQPQPQAPAPPVQQAAPAPAPAPTPAPVAPPAPAYVHAPESDSANIRQLELRAIFGVDREMQPEEILQRARALPGIRHIARVNTQDIATIDALKTVVTNLGFGAGGLKLFAGSVPIEFIRESGVLLAVQTDGGFAPGVRETLMIVGRELSRC